MEYYYALLGALAAFLITFTSIPAIIKVAEERNLFDEPDKTRKLHISRIPNLGGIAIFGGFMITTAFFANFSRSPLIGYMMSAVVILFFTGLKDDIIPLTPLKKLFAQIIASLIIVLKCDIRFSTLYGFFWIEELPYLASVLFTLFTLLVIINAFNLIDGINGLAGGIGLIVMLVFSIFFYWLGAVDFVIVALSLAGAILAFLWFNLRRQAKIFMGDTGALILGLVSAVLAIKFIELNRVDGGNVFRVSYAPVLAFTVLIVPLFDTLRVFLIRIWQKRSPFSPDRLHLHHVLIDLGLHHYQASVVLYCGNLAFIAVAVLLYKLPAPLALAVVLLLATIVSVVTFQYKEYHKKLSTAQEQTSITKRVGSHTKSTSPREISKEFSKQ